MGQALSSTRLSQSNPDDGLRSLVSIPYFAVLVGLYEEPERPVNAVDYVRKFMGETAGDDAAQLRAEND